jgi:2-polyprenyl-6-methoxyphenol hydroxylase-like FAD-dependent oxidoreductase
MIGQPDIEKLLVNRLNNNIVHYSEKVVDLYEYEDGVTIITDTGRKVHSRYLIGADGARSTVRTTLGIPFTGTKPEMVSAVLDTFLDTDFPTCPEIITFQLNGRSKVSWIPRERGMARFYVLLDGDITQKRAEDSIREHLSPYRVEFIKTEWFSKFEGKVYHLLYTIFPLRK